MTAVGPAVLVDADGCPVKPEVYKVARRHHLQVKVVSNTRIQVPVADWLTLVVVPGRFDAADDWIVEHVDRDDIVITSDLPLAARCLKKNARVIDPKGGLFTEDNIGDALASRELMASLRAGGAILGGPAPFEPRDRSRFLHRLDAVVREVRAGTGVGRDE